MGAEPACFAPVVIRGRVRDLASGDGLASASLVALDVNGSARSSVVASGADGSYEIAVTAPRDAQGKPLADAVTLRVAAHGYDIFPTAPREALPIDLAMVQADDDARLVVSNAATDVALAPLSGDVAKLGRVEGNIHHALASGALVVAVQNSRAVSSAIADRDGAFVLFNVPEGASRIEAYRAGLRIEAHDATLTAAERVTGVTLAAATEPLATVSGSVSLVNAPGDAATSVILVLRSTFSQTAAAVRGLAPAGLRMANVDGAFEIDAVPPGQYAVLAAFENDHLVRDPDQGIAGTDVVFIDIPAEGGAIDMSQSFKITAALEIAGPGAAGLERLPSGAAPTFRWADDSSEDGYELRVFDSSGNLVHEAKDLPRVSSGMVEYTWTNAALKPGEVYQFRVLSWRERRNDGSRTYISATEDLRGTFEVAPATR